MSTLRFGTSGSVEIDRTANADLLDQNQDVATPIADVASAIAQALQEPLDFPPLRQIVLSDDRVVILLQPELPCASGLLAGSVAAIMQAGVPPELITVVRAAGDCAISDAKLLSEMDASLRTRLRIVEHDPTNREQLSFLGATKNDHPIYVNRELADAGFVLPIGVQGASDNIHSSWFPAFSDHDTQSRFHKAMSSRSKKTRENQLAECDEVGWMTGIQFVVQLVPAGDDRALHVVAGSPQTVWRQANALFQETWKIAVREPAGLVLAGIGGGPDQQTWNNVARAVDRLLDAVEVDGAIAICSQLKTKPGPALRRLAQSEDFERTEKAIRRTATSDAVAACCLHRARQRVKIYLLSELRESDVEDLGMAFVSNAKEIAKLSTQFTRCLTLENAQHVTIARSQD